MILKKDWEDFISVRDQRTECIVRHLAHDQLPTEVLPVVVEEFPAADGGELQAAVEHAHAIMSKVHPGWISEAHRIHAEQLVYQALSRGARDHDELRFILRRYLRALTLDALIDNLVGNVSLHFTNASPWPEEVKLLFTRRGTDRLIRQDEEHFIGRLDSHAPANSKVAFYQENVISGVGLISGIDQEGGVTNTVRITPVVAKFGGRIVTKSFDHVTFKVKGVPLTAVTDSEFLRLKDLLCPTVEAMPLGFRMVGGFPVWSGPTPMVHETSLQDVIDDLESRIIVEGLPSSAKTVSQNVVLRGLAERTDLPIIAVAPMNPNLARFGAEGQVIQDASWNADDLGGAFLSRAGGTPLPDYHYVVLHEATCMPDMTKLSSKTILEVLTNFASSQQIMAMLSARIAGSNPEDVLDQAEEGTLLTEEDGFSRDQIGRARKYANILREMFGTCSNVIDLGAVLHPLGDTPKRVGIHVPDDSIWLNELLFIVLVELLARSPHVYDPRKHGKILVMDELPAVHSHPGSAVQGEDVARVFRRLVLQGRNRGILMAGIVQNGGAIPSFFPGDQKLYPRYRFERRGGFRVGTMRNVEFIVPPVAFC